MNEVQALIDSLAARVRRPAGVDDRRFHAVAYSSHPDDVDPVRRASILGRQAPEAVTDWLEELGVRRAGTRLRVPANPALGMVARWCFPVRFGDHLLGFLWLAEDGPPLDEAALVQCEACAGDLAQVLWRDLREEDRDRRAEAQRLRALLGGAPVAEPLAHAPLYAVLLVAPVAGSGGADLGLAEAVDRLRRTVAPRHQLADVTDREALVLVAAATPEELAAHAATLAAAAHEELGAEAAGGAAVVALGGAVPSLADVPASAEQARAALRVARAVPPAGGVAAWSALGALGLVAELVADRDPAALLPAPLRRLRAAHDAGTLVATLATYLDHAGDAAAAAAELHLHRSSLYNRLRRIEEVAGVDLRDGDARLELHLGLRLLQLGVV